MNFMRKRESHSNYFWSTQFVAYLFKAIALCLFWNKCKLLGIFKGGPKFLFSHI